MAWKFYFTLSFLNICPIFLNLTYLSCTLSKESHLWKHLDIIASKNWNNPSPTMVTWATPFRSALKCYCVMLMCNLGFRRFLCSLLGLVEVRKPPLGVVVESPLIALLHLLQKCCVCSNKSPPVSKMVVKLPTLQLIYPIQACNYWCPKPNTRPFLSSDHVN